MKKLSERAITLRVKARQRRQLLIRLNVALIALNILLIAVGLLFVFN